MVDWIAAVFSIIGIYFNAKKNIVCWPFWIAGNFIWLYYFSFVIQEWPVFTVFFFFQIMNVYGWIQWSKNE